MASLIKFSSSLITSVWIGNLFGGGVDITDISLADIRLNCSVLGIGVAVRASTSTLVLNALRFSLIETPNFCSSSTIRSPKFLKFIFLLTTWWVPIKISISPSSVCLKIFVLSFWVLNLLMYSIFKGKSFSLFSKFLKCWKAKIVVGTRNTTWRPLSTALKAALIAISVFPNPTSPHISLSMGISLSMSFLTALVASTWSFVSSKKKDASNSLCKLLSWLQEKPIFFLLFAYKEIRSKAISFNLFFVLSFNIFQLLDPNLLSLGFKSSFDLNFEILWREWMLTYKMSLSAYVNLITSWIIPSLLIFCKPEKIPMPWSMWVIKSPFFKSEISLNVRASSFLNFDLLLYLKYLSKIWWSVKMEILSFWSSNPW